MSIFIIIGKFSGSMENSQGTVQVLMNFNFYPDVMTTILVRGNLQRLSFKAYAIIRAHRSFVMFTKRIFDIRSRPRDKSRTFFQRFLFKLFIVCRQIDILDVKICRCHAGNVASLSNYALHNGTIHVLLTKRQFFVDKQT